MFGKAIELCLLPKLARNYDECEHHEEYELRNTKIGENFCAMLATLEHINIHLNLEAAPKVLAYIYILYKELLSEGPWHSKTLNDCAEKLNLNCQVLLEITAKNILRANRKYNKQLVFDECMQWLHVRLTASEFKKYPSLVEVYCSMVSEIKDYRDVVVSVKILPVSLYLIDDYIPANKIKGLKSCHNILVHLKPDSFADSNYYEVVFVSLEKVFTERDLKITKLVISCITALFKAVNSNKEFRILSSEKLYKTTLDQLKTESNLHRKAELFNFAKQLIEMIGINCVIRKAFHSVIYENLEISCNEGVEEVLLNPVLECFEEWLKNCWAVWNPKKGEAILSLLFKVLYTCSTDNTVDKIVKIIATLLLLCTDEEKNIILKNLEDNKLPNKKFNARIAKVKKYVKK